MRYLNLIVASSLMLIPTLSSCGGEGEENEEAAGTETGDGDGDPGDGDGAPGDGDGTPGDGDGAPGDGDGAPGDGDGDPGDGDGDPGDGDGDPGDGDGDPECIPADDNECSICTAENCCEELQACEASTDCACIIECAAQAVNPQQCVMMCGVNPVMVPELMALRACTMMSCTDACD